jgi:hypothetical protein
MPNARANIKKENNAVKIIFFGRVIVFILLNERENKVPPNSLSS